MLEAIERRFGEIRPSVDFFSLRFVHEQGERLGVQRDIARPVRVSDDVGVMLTVRDRGGIGYAATCDLSPSGLRQAAERARQWAHQTAGHAVTDFSALPRTALSAEVQSPVRKPWNDIPTREKLDLLVEECRRLRVSDEIVLWSA